MAAQNRKLVESVPFFKNCDFNVILKVLEHLETKMYMPGKLQHRVYHNVSVSE